MKTHLLKRTLVAGALMGALALPTLMGGQQVMAGGGCATIASDEYLGWWLEGPYEWTQDAPDHVTLKMLPGSSFNGNGICIEETDGIKQTLIIDTDATLTRLSVSESGANMSSPGIIVGNGGKVIISSGRTLTVDSKAMVWVEGGGELVTEGTLAKEGESSFSLGTLGGDWRQVTADITYPFGQADVTFANGTQASSPDDDTWHLNGSGDGQGKISTEFVNNLNASVAGIEDDPTHLGTYAMSALKAQGVDADGNAVHLAFDDEHPVQIKFANANHPDRYAKGRAFVSIDGATFVEITDECKNDGGVYKLQDGSGERECKYTSGDDLYILTNHFTEFGVLSEESSSSNGGEGNTPSNSGSTSGSSHSSGGGHGFSSPEAPSCPDSAPAGHTDLFQIDRNGDKATLHFIPVADASSYHIVFGHKEGEETYGLLSAPVNGNEGVQSVTIDHLDPKKAYSFQVMPVRGCAVGARSNWLNVLKNKITAYRY